MSPLSWIRFNILIIAVSFSVACSTTGKPDVEQPATVENPIAEVNNVENQIIKARQDQLNILSPDWFAKAEASYLKARDEVENGAEISDILENVAEARSHLQRAEETAKIARTMLDQIIESRSMARRTISLTDQSKKLVGMQPEETALWMEGILNRITTQLSARDMRDQEFNTQEENILGSIKSL